MKAKPQCAVPGREFVRSPYALEDVEDSHMGIDEGALALVVFLACPRCQHILNEALCRIDLDSGEDNRAVALRHLSMVNGVVSCGRFAKRG